MSNRFNCDVDIFTVLSPKTAVSVNDETKSAASPVKFDVRLLNVTDAAMDPLTH